MSDRLKNLQRQRALAQEQMERLDREIACEMGSTPHPAVSAAVPVVPPEPVNLALDANAEEIIGQYRSDKPVHNEVRKGCFVYLFAAFALVGLGIALLYLFRNR